MPLNRPMAVATALLLALGALGACSSSGGSAGSGGSSASTSTASSHRSTALPTPPSSTTVGGRPTSSYATFTGSVDDFYRVPSPLPKGPPGQLIRIQRLAGTAQTASLRVMYHSVDATGRDRAVTGTVSYPTGPAPKGGWPVVAWSHGTTGLATQCAPSRTATSAPAFGIQGVAVATDYIGLGPIGELHSYLDGPAEAHAVIDAVRAARTIAAAHASSRWVGVGHSQGGHSALWANQLGATYAPELHLLGTVAIAPASMLTETYGPTDQVVPRMVGVMALYGGAADHPEIHPHDYVGTDVAKADGVIRAGCLDQIVDAFVRIPASTFYKRNPLTTDPAASLVRASDPGTVRVASPLLLVYGTADAEVIPARAHALFDRLCRLHQVTGLDRVDGGTHDSVLSTSGAAVTAWLQGRIAGKPAPDACAAGFR